MHRSDPLLKMKLVPKVTANSKKVLLQNKDRSLTTGCLTRNLHHGLNKLDLNPLEAQGWKSQLKKQEELQNSALRTQPQSLCFSISSHRAINRNAQALECGLEKMHSQAVWNPHLQQAVCCFNPRRTSSNSNRLGQPLKTTVLMRAHLNIGKYSGLFRKWSENTLPHDEAGKKGCPLKQSKKITKCAPNMQKNPVTEMHKELIMNPPGFT